MTDSITFEVCGRPQGKERARTVRNTYTGKIHSYTPKKTSAYEEMIRLSYKSNNGRLFDGPVEVEIIAYMPIPLSFNKKQKADAVNLEMFPQVKPDNDNIEKIVFDALSGTAYHDDTQIVVNKTEKRFSDNSRLVVTISEHNTKWYKKNGKYNRIKKKD